MTIVSARICAAAAALLLGLAAPGTWASDGATTTASVTIQGSAAVTIVNTIVNNAPMQTMLLTAAIAPVSVFAAPSPNAGAGLVSIGNSAGTGAGGLGAQGSGGAASTQSPSGASGAGDSGGGPGADGSGGGAPAFAGSGSPGVGESGPPALIVLGGSLNGTTIDGDAISVNVSDVSGGSTADSAKVPVVIAQYN